MPVLNSVAVSDTYANNTGANQAILSQVYNSRGGWFSITGQPVFVQMQYGPQGSGNVWTEEVEVGAGAFAYLDPKCTGVRFRNAVAGQVATVTAQISEGDEPPLSIIALGSVSVAGVAAVTRQVFSVAGLTSYIPPNGCTTILVEVVAGGGHGGQAIVGTSGQVAVGGGGGGGGYAADIFLVANLTTPISVRVGAGAAGASPAGNSFFTDSGSVSVEATGGANGTPMNASVAAPVSTLGGAGGSGTVGAVLVDGGAGGYGLAFAAGVAGLGGAGGAGAVYGAPGQSPQGLAASGTAGQEYGGGGSGGVRTSSTGTQTAGAGHDGLVVVTEYY